MDLLNIFALSGLVNCLVVMGLGVFVILHSWRDKLNRLYFLIVIAISMWSFSYWVWLSSTDAVSALFWVRILSIGSTLIPVFYFHWVVAILKIEKRERNTLWLVYLLGILFILFSFSNLFISGVERKLFFPFWPNPGILYHFYLFVSYIFLIIYSSNLLLKNYIVVAGEDRKRLAYVMAGALVAFVGGLSNFFLWYDIPIAPYGNFLVAIYPLLLGYATIKYKLFNIKVVTTELFVIVIWVFLLVKTLLSNSYGDLILNGVVLVAVMVAGILLVKSVIKEVKQREQIQKMAEDVKRAYEIEKKAKEELEKLDKTKNQFLMTIQHHLKTPLTSMMGYSDLLLKGVFGKQNKKTVDVITRFRDSTVGLIKMVNEFLDVTQFQLGKGVISLKPNIDIVPMVEQVVSELKFQAEQNGLYLKLEKPDNMPLIKADLEKLRAALFNIFDNSIKYTQKGGVTIKIEKGKVLRIKSSDTGIGMSQERIQRLFNSTFERGDDAKKSNATGRGIGLYLASEIIKAHNGKLWAESDGEGKGSTFFIELPVN